MTVDFYLTFVICIPPQQNTIENNQTSDVCMVMIEEKSGKGMYYNSGKIFRLSDAGKRKNA
jgi:hypothetical protein